MKRLAVYDMREFKLEQTNQGVIEREPQISFVE